MNHSRNRKYAPVFVLSGSAIAIALSSGGCSAANSAEEAVANAKAAVSGCDEFSGGAASVAKLSIDGDAKAFVTASANLVALANTAEKDVLAACIGIATDLHIADTWTAKAPHAGAAPDDEVTEVCTQVSNKITAVLAVDASAMCTFVVSGGHCIVDETEQVKCESSCSTNTTCQPGDITTLCTPASLTGECDGSCDAMATCEGSVTTQAQCQGACEGKCTGMCDADPCMERHCKGACAGTCTGDCQIAAAAQVNCGASVSCRGGCSVKYVAPECETTVTPPVCNVSQTCQASCKSNVEVTSKCTPPGASLECSADVSADVQAVIDTVQKNLPAIVLLVNAQGTLALDAANNVVTTGKVVVNNLTKLGGKAFACAGAAAEADVSASASVNVSVSASSKVSGSCGGPTRS
jgi:hypothetical protein